MSDNTSIYAVNDSGEACMRISENVTSNDPTSIYGVNEVGEAAVRVIGGSGGGGSSDVKSVNGKKGVVVLTAKDVEAIPQYETMPTANASNLGNIVQYIGESGETYTNGYFYKNKPQTTDSSATISQTSGIVPATATFTTVSGDVNVSANPEDVESFYSKHWSPAVPDTLIMIYSVDAITVADTYYGTASTMTQEELEAEGFVFSGTFVAGCQVRCEFVPTQKLQNIAVDVKTFETAEQPTGNKTVNFVAGKTTLSVLSGNNGGMTVTIDQDVLVSRFPELMSGMSGKPIYKINVNGIYLEGSGWDNNLRAQLLIFSDPDTHAMTMNLDTDTNRDYYGITISGVGFEQNIEYTVISNSLVEIPWTKNGTTVNIAEYGISYSGMPTENTTLTVTYLAPAVIGYGWEQINVQPEPKEGIDWKVKLDLPAEYAGDLWNAFPVYTIADGLPDGKYKLYFSTKQYSEYAQSSELYAENVFCVLLNIQNNTKEFQGVMGYVFDGEYIPSPNITYALDRLSLYTFVATKGNDITIYATTVPFSTSVLGNMGAARLIPECFKISAITNIETGEEYIPTGYVPLDGQLPDDINNYNGQVVLAQLGNQPYIPSRSIISTLSDSEVNNSFGLRVNTCAAPKTYIRCSSGDDVFYAYVYRTPNEYEQEILQATGKFENWKFKFFSTSNNYVDIDLGTPDFTRPISVVAGVFGADSSSGFNISPVTNSGDLASHACPYVGIGKSCRMETPTANQLNGVVQYVGETNANYTKGANYTAKGTIIVVPESAVVTNINPNIATISIDASTLIPALSTYTGWSESYIRDQLNNGHTWQIGYDFDNNQIISLFWSVWGGFDASIWSLFTVTPASGQSGTQTINFGTQYTPESKELQNGYWELLQPNLTSITGYDTTKTQVLKNVNGTMTWVDEA